MGFPIEEEQCISIAFNLIYHIFQNAQVTSNKMIHKKKHHFLAQIVFCFIASVSLNKAKRFANQLLSDVLNRPFNIFG